MEADKKIEEKTVVGEKIFGVDLGTTNSVSCILEGGNPKIIINSLGSRLTPSVVAFSNKKELLVGEVAKRQAILNTKNTFSSIKRLIGLKFSEIKKLTTNFRFEITADEMDRILIHCPILHRFFSPEEISAHLLRKLKTDASAYLGTQVSKAVITVPAYFNDSQRQATKDAGTLAGLDVLRILNEPTAAALAYGIKRDKNELILVFDLGGGTFDISILEIGPNIFEVLATSGDTFLGGDDFDSRIAEYLQTLYDIKIEKNNQENSIKNKQENSIKLQALQRILEASERAKIELSTLQFTEINLPFICISPEKFVNIETVIERSTFEKICEDLFKRCKEPIFKALNDAKLNKEDINQILLVGGSTRIPAIRKMLKEIFNLPLNETVNPDEVVAIGAAIQAGILAGEITDLILLDVTPLSLGIETIGGLMTTVIPRNTSVPVKRAEMFSTTSDGQTSVEIHVLQGEKPIAANNRSLGIFTLEEIPIAPKGIPQIRVSFELTSDGLLLVSARDDKTNLEQSISIEGSSVLSQKEIENLLQNEQDQTNL